MRLHGGEADNASVWTAGSTLWPKRNGRPNGGERAGVRARGGVGRGSLRGCALICKTPSSKKGITTVLNGVLHIRAHHLMVFYI